MSCWTFMWVIVQKKYVAKKKAEEIDSGAWDRRQEAKMKAGAYQRLTYAQRYAQYQNAEQRAAQGLPPQQQTIDDVEEMLQGGRASGTSVTLPPSNGQASRSATPVNAGHQLDYAAAAGMNMTVVVPSDSSRLTKTYKLPNMSTGIVNVKDVEMKIHSNKAGSITYSGMTTDSKEYSRIQFIIHFKGMTAPFDRVCSQILHKPATYTKQRVDFDMSFDKIKVADLSECFVEVRHYTDAEGRYGEVWGDYLTTDQDAGKKEEAEWQANYLAKKRAALQQNTPVQVETGRAKIN